MRKIAFIFPGQGSQYVGMGKELCDAYEIANRTYDEASEVLNMDIKKLIQEGDVNELMKTENTQPAVFITSIAALRVYKESIGIDPVVSAGHSLGEITALTCAGAIDFKDAINIVKNRALFMMEASSKAPCAMYAIRNLNYKSVEYICRNFKYEDKTAVISNYNSMDQIVISGDFHAVESLKDCLEKEGALATKLKVSGAFHSNLMESASVRLKDYLKECKFNDFKIPVISNVTGEFYKNKDEIIDMLSNQIIKPVQWIKTMNKFEDMGVDTTVELGGGHVLSNLIRRNSNYIKTYTFEKLEDVDRLREEVENFSLIKKQNVIEKCISISVCTKNSNFNSEEYEKGVIVNHKKLLEINSKIEEENRDPYEDEIHEGISLLKDILAAKKTCESEKKERFRELANMIDNSDLANKLSLMGE